MKDNSFGEESIWQQTKWNQLQKVIFRFGLIYLSVYIIPNFLSLFGSLLFSESINILKGLVIWVGDVAFSKTITVEPNGSGDTTYNYVEVFTIFILSLLVAVIWTIVDFRRKNYRRLLYWLTVGIRYMLGITMLTYGLVKIFKTQFPEPSLVSMLKPFGETSPMGLLWKFMGYSIAYNVFTGLGEAIGGLFLFFRRTTTLGAMILLAVLSNVVILNFSYDVPVKLFSSHLLLMALILFLLDAKRVLNLLLWNRPAQSLHYPLPFTNSKIRLRTQILKAVILFGVISLLLYQSYDRYQTYGSTKSRPPLFGIYEVEHFVMNQDTLPASTTDSLRWKRMVVDTYNRFHIQNMQDNFVYYQFDLDTAKQSFTITPRNQNDPLYRVSYEMNNSQVLRIAGVKKSADSIFVEMKRIDHEDFLLTNRGFHWVNEYPFNR